MTIYDCCKGCLIFEAEGECHMTQHNMQEQCPCVDCLIKVMCGDPCDDMEDFFNSIHEDKK